MLKDSLDSFFQHCLESCIGVGVATCLRQKAFYEWYLQAKGSLSFFCFSGTKKFVLQCPQETCVCLC